MTLRKTRFERKRGNIREIEHGFAFRKLLAEPRSEAEKPECVRIALADLHDKNRANIEFDKRLMEFSNHYLGIQAKAKKLVTLIELSKQEDVSKCFDLKDIDGSEKDIRQKRVKLLLSAAMMYIGREIYLEEIYKKYGKKYTHDCGCSPTENQDAAADILAQARSEIEPLDPKLVLACGIDEVLLRKEAIEIRNTAGGFSTYHFLYDLSDRCERCAGLIREIARLAETTEGKKEMLAEAEEYEKLAQKAIKKGKHFKEIKFSPEEPAVFQFSHDQRKC